MFYWYAEVLIDIIFILVNQSVQCIHSLPRAVFKCLAV